MLYDAVIVGGGPVGLAMALGMQQKGWKVAVIEKNPYNPMKGVHGRWFALSPDTIHWLESLATSVIPGHPLHTLIVKYDTHKQYRPFHVSAEELGVCFLARMVCPSVLQRILYQALINVDVIHGACVTAYTPIEKGWSLRLDNERLYKARLVIGADGYHSQVRETLHPGSWSWTFAQHVHTFVCEPYTHIDAYEEFFPEGVLAILPIGDNRASCIWIGSPIMGDSTPYLRQQIEKRCGHSVHIQEAKGVFGARMLGVPCTTFRHGMVVGDAAHSMHPLAGQGLNVNMRVAKKALAWLAQSFMRSQFSDMTVPTYQKFLHSEVKAHTYPMQFFLAATVWGMRGKKGPLLWQLCAWCAYHFPGAKRWLIRQGTGAKTTYS